MPAQTSAPPPQPRSILIFRIGSLGDTLVAVPAMWEIRRRFPAARITLLCDVHPGRKYVVGSQVLEGSGIVDDFLSYPVIAGRLARWTRPIRLLKLLLQLRRAHFDTLVYLAPSARTREQIDRDRRFFRLGGIGEFIGMEGFVPFPQKKPGIPLPVVPSEAQQLLTRLAASGIPAPRADEARTDLNLTLEDQADVDQWVAALPGHGGKRWIGVGPGSKMPVKIWPRERYEQVVRRLIDEFDVWPVIFGGAEDKAIGDAMIATWGRGYNAAGTLGLRAAAAAISRCTLYLGNDTGTMHLAAAGAVRCVAVFCSHVYPGWWYPLGSGHHVFRTPIECENCFLEECIQRNMECILSIGVSEVHAVCAQVLAAAQPAKLVGKGG